MFINESDAMDLTADYFLWWWHICAMSKLLFSSSFPYN